MPKVSGIQLEKNTNGELTYVRINMKKHGERIMPILKDLGAVKKTQFQLDCENGKSVNEVFDNIEKWMDSKWDK